MSAAICLLGALIAAPCPKEEVEVQAKTPLRRGPGLNYPVVGFVEKAACFRLDSSSMDGRFSLVEGPPGLGWVLTERLDPAGQARARQVQPEASPIGSGKTRQEPALVAAAVLREGPAPEARSRGPLPGGARVVPLRLSADRAWVELRTARGDVGWVLVSALPEAALRDLPVDAPAPLVSAPEPAPEPEQGVAVGRVGGRGQGVHLLAEAGVGFVALGQSLGSDAPSGLRRYDLNASALALSVQLQLSDLGPLTARGWFSGSGLDGLSTDGRSEGVGGTALGAGVRVGWPLAFAELTLTPELGYRFDGLSLDVAFPGDAVATLVSADAHLAEAGLRAQWVPGPAWLVAGELAGGFGSVASSPGSLGSGGLAGGLSAALEVHRALWGGLSGGLRGRYGMWTVSYEGASSFDATIEQADLSQWAAAAEVVLGFAL